MQANDIGWGDNIQIDRKLLDISHLLWENIDNLPTISYIRWAISEYIANVLRGDYQHDTGIWTQAWNKLLVLMWVEIFVSQSRIQMSVDTLLSTIPVTIVPWLEPIDYLLFARKNVWKRHCPVSNSRE